MILSNVANAQKYLYGKVVNLLEETYVPNAFVENVSRNYISVADTLGNFSIPATIGDTLVVSSVGYHWKKVIVKEIAFMQIVVDSKSYRIGAVVKNAPIPYEEFKQQILSMDFEEDTLHLNLAFKKYYPMSDYQPGHLSYRLDGVITALYNSTSRHARNQVRAVELIKNEHKLVTIQQKFNKDIVTDLTSIPEEYLDEFMAFCNFSDVFLYEASEFHIISLLYLKYDAFLCEHSELQKI